MSEREKTWGKIRGKQDEQMDKAMRTKDANVFGLRDKQKEIGRRLRALETRPERTQEEIDFETAKKSALEMIDAVSGMSVLQDIYGPEDALRFVTESVLGKKNDPETLNAFVVRLKAEPEIASALDRFESRRVQAQKDILRHTLSAYLEMYQVEGKPILPDEFAHDDLIKHIQTTCSQHNIGPKVCEEYLGQELEKRLIELAKELILDEIINEQMRRHIEKLFAAEDIFEFTTLYKQNPELIDRAIQQKKKYLIALIINEHLQNLIEQLQGDEYNLAEKEMKNIANVLHFLTNEKRDLFDKIGYELELTIRTLELRARSTSLNPNFVRKQIGNEIQWVIKRILDRGKPLSDEKQKLLNHILDCLLAGYTTGPIDEVGLRSFVNSSGVRPKRIKVDLQTLRHIIEYDMLNHVYMGGSNSVFQNNEHLIKQLLGSSSSPIQLKNKLTDDEYKSLLQATKPQIMEESSEFTFLNKYSRLTPDKPDSPQPQEA
jgi:hypothetical protein